MTTRRRSSLVVLLLAVACTGEPERPPVPTRPTVGPAPAGTVRVAYPAEPPTLNPVAPHGAAASTRDVLRPVFPALFSLDAKLRPHPELAAAWPSESDVTRDPFTVRIRLRAARWSDGKAITSADVRFSWERLRDGPTRARYRLLVDVEAVSPRVVRLHFGQPVRRWWALFSVDDMVLPAHAFGDGSAFDRATPVAGGPFAVDGWTPGLKIRLRRNPSWWGSDAQDAPIQAIEVLFVPDDETRLQLLDAREVELVVGDGDANFGNRSRAHGAPPLGEGAALTGAPGASWSWAPAWWELDVNLARVDRQTADAIGKTMDRRLVIEMLEDSAQVMDGLPARFPVAGARSASESPNASGEAASAQTADGLPAIDGPWEGLGGDAAAGRAAARGRKPGELLLAFARGPLSPSGIARFLHFAMRDVGVRVEIAPVEAPDFERAWIAQGRADAYVVLRRGSDAPPTDAYRSESPPSVNPARVRTADAAVDESEIDGAQFGKGGAGLRTAGWDAAERELVQTRGVYPLARVRAWITSRGGVSGPRAVGSAAGPFWNAAEWRVVG